MLKKTYNKFPKVLQNWLEHKKIEEIECVISDMAGVVRGKAMPLSKFEKLDTKTNPNSTHPGYLERYSSLEKFIDNYQVKNELKVDKSSKWRWEFNRDLNILTFIPLNKF